ncbi:GNAT family N-acetyltransferase [Streptomyces sp. H27-H5]|nr:GNAT family N-acetyltransferase [Streptomyces sp. H27-H5]
MNSSTPRLVPVTPENFDAVCAIRLHPHQEHLVSPVLKSLAEAYGYGANAWPRAIVDRRDDGAEEVVGFVMAFLDFSWNGDATDRRSGIWRLNISAEHQGRGYGRFAVGSVSEEIRGLGGTRAYVTWNPGEHTPEPFYLGLGFTTTGELSGTQRVGVLAL